ncbi:MAG: sulfatase-like hydrolase/transferase [Candidatus Nomurabacteria bacterium]|jgi:phosphoglycerol transferase MdoB-like AlkP superfamily enzyme|nr:sulfatase-like hydrolase/transferase [Candidatus Nomurabacteria bacterium]
MLVDITRPIRKRPPRPIANQSINPAANPTPATNPAPTLSELILTIQPSEPASTTELTPAAEPTLRRLRHRPNFLLLLLSLPTQTTKTHRPLNLGLLLGLFILTQEILLKLLAFSSPHIIVSLALTALWTLPAIAILALVFHFLPHRLSKILAIILASTITIIFIAQYSFTMLYGTPVSFAMTGTALDTGLDFIGMFFDKVAQHWWQNGLFALVLTIFIIILSKTKSQTQKNLSVKIFILSIASIALPYLSFVLPHTIGSPYNLYFQTNNISANTDTFGLLTAERLDLQRLIFGFTESAPEVTAPAPVNPTDPTVDYHGMFKNKNLIFIVGESFSELALRPDTTPTLYRLRQEGFNFTNFYEPTFYSTIGGEFMATTGLLPTPTRLSNWQNGKTPNFQYALGFWPGYQTRAYHDWLYSYYSRNISRPTLGFANRYKGCYNGLEQKMDCKTWPASDSEFAQNWGFEFIGDNVPVNTQPKATYILTVSGHGTQFDGWSFAANAQSRKHRDAVEAAYPDLSENAKSYLAANMELDLMVAELLRQAEAAGELDNTVIALVGDHPPYAMTSAQCDELATLPLTNNQNGDPISTGFFGKDACYRGRFTNPFLLWTPTMRPTQINKVGYAADILPTLLNLFAIPYDSSQLAGQDLLNPATEGLAIFPDNRSWVSDRAKYDASSREWQANPGYEEFVNQDYINQINALVANRFTIFPN